MGYIPHAGITGHQQLIDKVGDCRRGDPLAGMDVGLYKNGGISLFIRDLNTPDGPALVGVADGKGCDYVRISGLDQVQPGVYFIQSMELGPFHGAYTLFRPLGINVGLHIVDLEVIAKVVVDQEALEAVLVFGREHKVRGFP